MTRLVLSLSFSLFLLASSAISAAPCGTVTFDLPQVWPASTASVFADFNQDGLMDVATYQQTGITGFFSLNLLLGTRTFGFQAVPIAPFLESPSLRNGDFDGDGRPDLVISSLVDGKRRMSLLRGDGRGGLTTAFTTEISSVPRFAGDFDGDGRDDLLDVGGKIFHGSPDGTFSSMTIPPLDFINSSRGAVADFDGDGKSDLVYSSPTGIVIATGASGMTSRIMVAGFFSPSGLKVADVNGDGRPDVLFSVNSTGLNVALNHGGTFSGWIPTNGWVTDSVALGDVDGDGLPDILTAGRGEGMYFHANSDGTYAPGQRFMTNTFAWNYGVFAVADFNGDGMSDVATMGDRGLMIVPNRGNGVLGGQPMLTTSDFSKGLGRVLAAVDVNGDQRPDVISAGAGGQLVTWLNLPGGFVSVTSGNTLVGDPTFLSSTPVPFAYGDINGDGLIDILTTRPGNGTPNSGRLIRYLGDGQGQFVPASDTYAVGTDPLDVFLTDVDGDGRNEIVIFNWLPTGSEKPEPYALEIVRIGAGGALEPPIDAVPAGRRDSITAGDFNGDGRLDFIIRSSFDPALIVFNDGHGGYLPSKPSTVSGGAVGDLNGDGKADVVNGSIYYSNGDGTFSQGPSAGNGLLADMDGDGLLDVVGRDADRFLYVRLNRGDSFTLPLALPVMTLSYIAADLDLDGRNDLVTGEIGFVLRNSCAAIGTGPRRRSAKS